MALLVLAACSQSPADQAGGSAGGRGGVSAGGALGPVATAPPLTGPNGFVALQSDAVRDAIHRALRTGRTQRWQDGALSGYAVPSLTADAHGCRAIRYTIDQVPNAPPASINACDAA